MSVYRVTVSFLIEDQAGNMTLQQLEGEGKRKLYIMAFARNWPVMEILPVVGPLEPRQAPSPEPRLAPFFTPKLVKKKRGR